MKVSEMRAALKTAKVKVWIRRACLRSCLDAEISVQTPPRYEGQGYWDTLVSVQCQADDYMTPDGLTSYNKEREEGDKKTLKFFNLYRVSHFYAAKIETEYKLGGEGYDAKSPARAESFFKVIQGVIEKLNLRFKYPNCELSQICEALKELGCSVELVSVEREDLYSWNKARRDSDNPGA